MISTGLALAAALVAQETAPIHYDLSFDNAVHHEARITVTYRDIGTAPLELRMSRSSPGRYAIHEFARNVYSVSAKDGAGRALEVSRDDPYSWTVAGHDGTVSVTYTLYADRADGTYSQIDATHAHLNAPATYMWAQGFDERPITVRFRPYDPDWKVATQLPPADAAGLFRSPNLQYLMDSPAELSDHAVRSWPVRDEGGRYDIRLTVHHDGTSEAVDRFAKMAENVVREQIAIFGDVPDFDFGTYTFLADYLPYVSGDGMEHRNSTIISNTRSLEEADFAQLGTLSHEFFHAWNVERLRPAELEPFDFTQANPTPSLWFAEGFTSYYGPLAIHRAGESTLDEYLGEISGGLDYVVNAPARRYGSPQDMSLRAPFVDAATAIDPTNHSNMFVSYYPYGAVIALALDLTLRQRFEGLSLDDYMRHLWKKHGVPEKPYTVEDLQAGLAEVTGDARFAEAFFAASIEDSKLPDIAPLLAQAGLQLRKAKADAGWAGPNGVEVNEDKVTVSGNAAVGTPLYMAGLERGDEIVSLGSVAIDSKQDWETALQGYKPGDKAEIRFIQRGQERSATITFVPNPSIEIVSFETAGLTPSAAQLAFREAWLGSKAD